MSFPRFPSQRSRIPAQAASVAQAGQTVTSRYGQYSRHVALPSRRALWSCPFLLACRPVSWHTRETKLSCSSAPLSPTEPRHQSSPKPPLTWSRISLVTCRIQHKMQELRSSIKVSTFSIPELPASRGEEPLPGGHWSPAAGSPSRGARCGSAAPLVPEGPSATRPAPTGSSAGLAPWLVVSRSDALA